MPTRKIIVNPDEPSTGDNGFSLYDAAHPVFGEADVINYLRKNLKGLRRKIVRMKVSGMYREQGGRVEKRFNFTSQPHKINSYSDLFGTGSLYGKTLHRIVEKDSDDQIVVTSITLIWDD